jgi:hypothetical protein
MMANQGITMGTPASISLDDDIQAMLETAARGIAGSSPRP